MPAGPDFEAAEEFDGARSGYAFGTGRQGTGYYREAAGPAAAAGDAVASATAAAGAHQILHEHPAWCKVTLRCLAPVKHKRVEFSSAWCDFVQGGRGRLWLVQAATVYLPSA